MREQEVGTYEMLWDCPFCSTPKLLGLTHRHCPNCGGAQDPQARYYPSDEDKVAVENHAYYGADLLCPACSTPNSAKATFCTGCGSPIEGAKQAAARAEQVAQAGQAFAGESIKDAKAEARAARQAASDAAAGKTDKAEGMSKGLKIGLIVGAVVIVVGLAVFFLLVWKKEVALAVEGHSWKHSVEIEVFKAVSESAWCDKKPRKAYGVTETKEVRDHKKIPDGEECRTKRKDNRDGTFKQVKECTPKFKKEPIYGKKCRYKIDKWASARTEKAEGTGKDPAPHGPKVELAKTGQCKGCEREGDKTQTYTVHYKNPASGETHDCEVPLDEWTSIEVGSTWKAKVGVVTTALDCDALEPAG